MYIYMYINSYIHVKRERERERERERGITRDVCELVGDAGGKPRLFVRKYIYM